MRWPWALAAAAVFLLLPGCATYTLLSPEERSTLQRTLTGKDSDKYLRLSYFVTPFFGDGTKKLLTGVLPDQVRLLEQPDGTSISPGPAEKILTAGTPVRIIKVEFPTVWALTERVLYTPRIQPWVYLDVVGEPTTYPFILVLRPQIKTQEEFLAELERYLSNHDLTSLLASWPEPVRAAIKEKNAILDMPADALEMAWGYPEIKRITYEGQNKREEWIYPGARRSAQISEGRVLTLQDRDRER